QKIKYVPGGSGSGEPLISFNTGAFESYGWSGNANAPIGREAAEAYATALQRLLHPQPPDPQQPDGTLHRRNVRVGGNTVVCYWAGDRRGDGFADVVGALLEADEEGVEKVGHLYRSIWNGWPPEIDDDAPFFVLTLSGQQGRPIVRDWLSTSLQRAQENLSRHFADLTICRNTPAPKGKALPPQFSLRDLYRSLAVRGKSENVPAPLATRMLRAIFAGTPYPTALLHQAILRTRAEIGADGWSDSYRRDCRAALIKAVLERRRRFQQTSYPEIKTTMDPHNDNPGYVLGRLMAVIERMQTLALGDVNATVVDRYFGAASAAPRAVFVRLLKNARHHASKAKDDDRTRGTARWLERQIDELADRFDPKHNGFPAHLSLEEQGLFILGYHQQRHAFFQSKAEREAAAETA
ncbi:MAG: type I-C CRISPR-associated protein Cas8c/Csd1, partial [Acidobacteria bacterium]